jgi:hypothetical protein
MTDLRQAAQQALEFLMKRRMGSEAVIESLNEALAREHAMHDLARLGQEIEQEQAEPCVGKDPRCPCQDGDACHYKDCGSTKALPVAQPEQEPTCPKCKAAVLYECVACSNNNYPPAAQPAQGPMISAWSLREVYFDEDGEPVMHRSPPAAPSEWPLIKNILAQWKAAQRPWVGLTDEEVAEFDWQHAVVDAECVRAIEALLKERNT